MSVTITPEPKEPDLLGWALKCACAQVATGVLGATYEAAATQRGIVDLSHEDDEFCAAETAGTGYVVAVEIDKPRLNMSNANAATVLGTLGYTGEDLYVGDAEAEDFLGRILIGLGVAPQDPGVPVTESTNGLRWIDCGRPEHYVQEKLAHLREIAMWATGRSRNVTWA